MFWNKTNRHAKIHSAIDDIVSAIRGIAASTLPMDHLDASDGDTLVMTTVKQRLETASWRLQREQMRAIRLFSYHGLIRDSKEHELLRWKELADEAADMWPGEVHRLEDLGPWHEGRLTTHPGNIQVMIQHAVSLVEAVRRNTLDGR